MTSVHSIHWLVQSESTQAWMKYTHRAFLTELLAWILGDIVPESWLSPGLGTCSLFRLIQDCLAELSLGENRAELSTGLNARKLITSLIIITTLAKRAWRFLIFYSNTSPRLLSTD